MATVTRRLEKTWAIPSGILGWLTAVNHRSIGLRYIITATIFFLLAGLQALAMRLQLAQSNMGILSPELYNQFFTMHGTAMMFLFAVPILEGFSIYLTPLMIGARDMAFPRLNAFAYFVYLFAGVILFLSSFLGVAPDSGWFAYVPLSGPGFSPGIQLDLWATMVTFLEVAALVAAVEIVVTIFKLRAPGMSLNRMPLFVWGSLVTAFMIIFAMPPLMLATLFLELDRAIGTHFYNPAAGGHPLLWQHLFWWFGHPDVYIILVPALGMVSSIVIAFTRRAIIGYTLIVMATVAIGILSFGLWVHHMYATGLSMLGMTFFGAASMSIAIPSGVTIFAWIATLWTGKKIVWKTPLLFVLGFIFIFVLGGITGVMVASVPFDQQVHDTYFVVAHFHYVLIGGAVFPLFGGLHYWAPKVMGRLPSERLGMLAFWLMFFGFNATFFPMHIIGFLGMPRRVYTYIPEVGWDGLNLFVSVSAFIFAAGVLVFLVNLAWSARRGIPAGDNPWAADSLEWATASPPPPYNFPAIPTVRSRYPLWEEHADERPMVMLRTDTRETLATTLLDARVEHRHTLPGPSIWPFFLALSLATVFLSPVIDMSLLPIGIVAFIVSIIAWNWPSREDRERPVKT